MGLQVFLVSIQTDSRFSNWPETQHRRAVRFRFSREGSRV